MNASLPFIQHTDGKWQVMPEAERFFRRIDLKGTKLVVVAVGGPYRSGKSWLLGCLAHGGEPGPSPFAVGNSVRACTKGIWMHCLPPNLETGRTVLLLDCEGLGSLEQNNTFDSELFSLGILLSSVFVLNTQGSINENALEQLELVVQFSKIIHVKEEEGKRPEGAEGSLERMKSYFPEFWWVLRDFALALEDEDGNPISSDEYLEDALRHRPGQQNARSRHKNEIRRAIREAFPSRRCYCLVRPVSDERQLRDLAKAELRPEFRQQVSALGRRVHSQAPTKQINGQAVTPPVFANLALSYVEALNTGGVPTIESAWANALRSENQKTLEQASELSRSLLAKFFVADKLFSQSDIQIFRGRALEQLRELVQSSALGEADTKREIWAKVEQGFQEGLRDKSELNEARVRQFITGAVEKAWKQLGMNRLAQALDLAGLRAGLASFRAAVRALPSTELTAEVAGAFLEEGLDEALEIFQQQLEARVEQLRKETQRLEYALRESQKQTQEALAKAQETQARVQETQARLQEANLRAEQQRAQHAQELERSAREAQERLQERLREQERGLEKAAKRGAQRQAEEHEKEMRALARQLEKAEAELSEGRAEIAALRRDQERSLAAHGESQAASAGLQRSLAAQQAELAGLREQLAAQAREAKEARLRQKKELAAREGQAAEAGARIRGLEEELEAARARELSSRQQEAEGRDKALELKNKELGAATKALKAKDQALKAHEKELAEKEKELNELYDRSGTMDDQIREFMDKVAKQEGLLGKKEELLNSQAAALQEQERELQELRLQLASAQRAPASSSSSSSKGSSSKTGGRRSSVLSRQSFQPTIIEEDEEEPAQSSYSPEDDDYDFGDAAAPADPVTPPKKKPSSKRKAKAPSSESESEIDEEHAARLQNTVGSPPPLRDPASCTIMQLRQWLNQLDVSVPQVNQKKQFWVDLVYESDPRLKGKAPAQKRRK